MASDRQARESGRERGGLQSPFSQLACTVLLPSTPKGRPLLPRLGHDSQENRRRVDREDRSPIPADSFPLDEHTTAENSLSRRQLGVTNTCSSPIRCWYVEVRGTGVTPPTVPPGHDAVHVTTKLLVALTLKTPEGSPIDVFSM